MRENNKKKETWNDIQKTKSLMCSYTNNRAKQQDFQIKGACVKMWQVLDWK